MEEEFNNMYHDVVDKPVSPLRSSHKSHPAGIPTLANVGYHYEPNEEYLVR